MSYTTPATLVTCPLGGAACAAWTSNVKTMRCCGARLLVGGNELVSLRIVTRVPLTVPTKPVSALPSCVKFVTVVGSKYALFSRSVTERSKAVARPLLVTASVTVSKFPASPEAADSDFVSVTCGSMLVVITEPDVTALLGLPA